MGRRGPAAASRLEVVREGRRLRPEIHDDHLLLPPAAPAEPNWSMVLPSATGQTARPKRLRVWAHEEWERIVPPLNARGILAEVDHAVIVDHCVAWAELRECIRTLSLEGHVIQGKDSMVRHPASMTAAQLRTALAKTGVQLGLSPADRARLTSPSGGADGKDDDPFD